MSSAVESVKRVRPAVGSVLGFDLLFGVVPLLLVSPLLAVEFQALWHRTAFTFFPIPICIVAGFAAWHWRSPKSEQPQRLLLARTSFLLGVGIFGVAVWRFSPFLAHCSLIFLFLGWAIERLGDVPSSRILGWAALLGTSMRLPGDLQTRLQDWLVQKSTAVLGLILDGLSVPYLKLANTFSMRGLEFSISECCTSVYSIHVLLSGVVLLLLLTHRSLLVAVASLLTVPFWAIVQMVLVLLSIVILKHMSERDASQGLDRALVELSVFMVVGGCCWATTWFFAKLFLPVPAADSGFEPEFQLLNSIACWPQPDPFAIDAPPINPSERWQKFSRGSSAWMQKISWGGAVCLVAVGVFSTYRLMSGGFAIPSVPASIRAQQLARIQWKELFPEVFDRLRRVEVTHEIQRSDNRDLGVIQWNFVWQGQVVQLSVTLPFRGRPRLASKYEALGWQVLSEQLRQYLPPKQQVPVSTAGAESQSTSVTQEPWTELKIANELGGQAIALMKYSPLREQSSSDWASSDRASSDRALSDPQQPPLEYRVVLFCESGEQLTVPQIAELYSIFYKANEHLRTKVEPSLLDLLGDGR